MEVASNWRLALLAMLLSASPAQGNDLSGLSRDMSYQEVKTWQERFMRSDPSLSERTEALRSIVRTSQFGERGLNRIFRNFEGNYAIDPRIPGVEESVLLQRSASDAQAKGYRRELLYAIEFHNDPRFSLEAMNRDLTRPWGNTDADLVIRHRASGLYGRVEVKDISLETQVQGLQYYKAQADKMAREGRFTGQPQFWFNRRPIDPRLREHLERRGIVALGNVVTGRTSTSKTVTVQEATAVVDRTMVGAARSRAALGGTQVGFGLWMLLDSAPDAWDNVSALWQQETPTTTAMLRAGQSASLVLTGSATALSGGALLASRIPGEAAQPQLYRLGRTGGYVSLGLMAASEGFLIARYVSGDVSSRYFWTSQWVMASAAGGTYAGSWLGSFVGGLAGKTPAAVQTGAMLGAAAGSHAGVWVGERTADWYYEWKFEKIDQEFGKFVYARYGIQ